MILVCPQGHRVVKASQGPVPVSAQAPDGWFYCDECEAISGTCGHSYGKGIFYSPSEIHQEMQAQSNEGQESRMIENIGSFNGVDYQVSTHLAPGTYAIDGRVPLPLKPDMSSMEFRFLMTDHTINAIVFAWDIRARAREIFFVLAAGFDSFVTTMQPREVTA